MDKASFETLVEQERRREAGLPQARFDAGGLEGGELENQEGGNPDTVKAAEETEEAKVEAEPKKTAAKTEEKVEEAEEKPKKAAPKKAAEATEEKPAKKAAPKKAEAAEEKPTKKAAKK
jgi:hypothetical protein